MMARRSAIFTAVILLFFGKEAVAFAQISADCITPEACGALGDGSHDDTAAIQAAIDHLARSNTGGTIPFRAATYVISQPLRITTPGVGLKGVRPGWPGAGGSFIVQKTPNSDVVEILYDPGANVYGNFIEDIGVISGGQVDSDNNTAGSAILIKGALGTKIRNVVVLNSYIGIHLISAINAEIADCNIQRIYHVPSYSFGILIEDDGLHPNASNWVNDTIINFPDQNNGVAIGLQYNGIMQDFMVRHVEVDHATQGLVFIRKGGAPSFDIQLSNVVIDQFTQYGALFQGFTNGSPSIIGGWFANAVRGNEQTAVYAQGSGGIKLIGIEFFGYNNTNKQASAVKLLNSSNDSLVESNSFRNWNNAITVDGTANVVISGNSFLNLDSGAVNPGAIYNSHIDIKGSSNRINVTGNTFVGNGNTGRSILIESGTYNIVSSNTWTSPYVPGGGFYLDQTANATNLQMNNVGN